MKGFYGISILLTLGLIIGGMITAGAPISVYVSLPSFVIVTAIPLFMLLASFSPAEILKAFSSSFKRDADKEGLKKAELLFGSLGKYIATSGATGILLGVVAMLTNLGDLEWLGKGLALALLVVFYALLLHILLVFPFLASIRKKLV